MSRILATLLICGLTASSLAPARAQESGKVPVTEDLRRADAVDRRLGIEPARERARDRIPTSVTPTNPTGVAGFDGPPGFVGDSVDSLSPLPPNGPSSDR